MKKEKRKEQMSKSETTANIQISGCPEKQAFPLPVLF